MVSPSGAGRKRITAYPLPEASTSGFQNLSSTFLPLEDFSSSFWRKEKLFWDLRFRSAKDLGFSRIELDLVCVMPYHSVIIQGHRVGRQPPVPLWSLSFII